ncbi:MAG: DEAD/DEAH box helicase family protein [Clostridia bacterium]|nr:DEAD/DEAH box helicase family protein [Clostridia bacterium]
MDWENPYDSDERAQVHVDSVSDGYLLSLNTFARVDIEFIASVTGRSYGQVISELGDAIYQNPISWNECFYQGWESCDEYLSGNILVKYKQALETNQKYKGYFQKNVDALSALLPEALKIKDIYITLGSPWVPPDVIDDFIYYLVGERKPNYATHATKYDERAGLWEIPFKTRFRRGRHSVKNSSVYGTADMDMLYIIENTLNMKTLAIYDKVSNGFNKSGSSMVVNQQKTVLVLEKQKKLIDKFREWVWQDKDRKERLTIIYENRFGSFRKREFDGSYLSLPNLNPNVSLYPYQKDAIARILLTPNTLLAHDVGSGKTYVMVAAGMELRRMGISKKNLYVVPNNLIGQWKQVFLEMYSQAKLLVVEPKDFTPAKKNNTLFKMKVGDYDGIIMAYSCFDAIPMSYEYYEEYYNELLDDIKKAREGFESKASIDRKKKSAQAALGKAKEDLKKSGFNITFDDLGINTLFVDEAHNYKNVPLDTKISKVLGISAAGSKKCALMLDKVKSVQKSNDGRGIVFATGTPITNSITDAYIMQSYLQSGQLAMLGLSSFDAWVGMFAERATDFEISVDTNSYRLATRFSRFHNLPELTAILSSVADFHAVDKSDGLPDFGGYSDSLISATSQFRDYLKEIASRADDVKKHLVKRNEDNMLKITTDGRKAALDLRLVDPMAHFEYESKVARCAENVVDLYRKTAIDKSAQLVFCDTSTPKAGFNVYDELSRLLVSYGIPQGEIAYVHDATTDKKRQALFKDVRAGKIRVLIGSTFKLGIGVNVQERLVAVHHLDVPWRPADMVQREGRILRQGNTCPRVMIFRYITERSFDAYSWQLLESKARFICQLLGGSLKKRASSDIDSTVLNYAEVKALAIGNPLIKERVEVANELEKLFILQREALAERENMSIELASIPSKIERQRELISKVGKDLIKYQESKRTLSREAQADLATFIHGRLMANILNPEEVEILEYQGFMLTVPAYMSEDKPCVYINGEHRYLLELGAEAGIIKRLDFFLDNLDRQLNKYKDGLNAYFVRQSELNNALKKKVGYSDKIEKLQGRIEQIDKKLGVKSA